MRGLVQALGPDVRIAIIDRVRGQAAAPTDGRAFAIWAGAKAVLEGLGVWEAIAGEAEAMTAIEITEFGLAGRHQADAADVRRAHAGWIVRQPTWCRQRR